MSLKNNLKTVATAATIIAATTGSVLADDSEMPRSPGINFGANTTVAAAAASKQTITPKLEGLDKYGEILSKKKKILRKR